MNLRCNVFEANHIGSKVTVKNGKVKVDGQNVTWNVTWVNPSSPKPLLPLAIAMVEDRFTGSVSLNDGSVFVNPAGPKRQFQTPRALNIRIRLGGTASRDCIHQENQEKGSETFMGKMKVGQAVKQRPLFVQHERCTPDACEPCSGTTACWHGYGGCAGSDPDSGQEVDFPRNSNFTQVVMSMDFRCAKEGQWFQVSNYAVEIRVEWSQGRSSQEKWKVMTEACDGKQLAALRRPRCRHQGKCGSGRDSCTAVSKLTDFGHLQFQWNRRAIQMGTPISPPSTTLRGTPEARVVGGRLVYLRASEPGVHTLNISFVLDHPANNPRFKIRLKDFGINNVVLLDAHTHA